MCLVSTPVFFPFVSLHKIWLERKVSRAIFVSNFSLYTFLPSWHSVKINDALRHLIYNKTSRFSLFFFKPYITSTRVLFSFWKISLAVASNKPRTAHRATPEVTFILRRSVVCQSWKPFYFYTMKIFRFWISVPQLTTFQKIY